MDVVTESRAALYCQHSGEHFKYSVHGPSFLQSIVQRSTVDTAGHKVGQQQQEIKAVETCHRVKIKPDLTWMRQAYQDHSYHIELQSKCDLCSVSNVAPGSGYVYKDRLDYRHAAFSLQYNRCILESQKF